MFSIYGLEGRLFHGRLEELQRVRPVGDVTPVASVHPVDAEEAPATLAQLNARKVQGYTDLERGPLYQAGQIMQRPVITVRDSDAVADAWRLLRDRRIHQAPVLDATDHLVGIVSERDLLTTISIDDGRVLDILQRQVKDVMTSPVVAAMAETDIRQIAHAMLNKGVDGVPIVNTTEALVGFVSRSDILRAVITDPPLSLWR